MEVPQAINLRQLSEQERRTNILLQELGRDIQSGRLILTNPNFGYNSNSSF